MKPSIIKTEKACFFCGSETDLERHHCVHGTANRPLWQSGHDRDLALKRAAEYAWIITTGKTVEDWITRYGKNYL